MVSDEPGDQCVGRSISAAKKAYAVFKIGLVSSQFSVLPPHTLQFRGLFSRRSRQSASIDLGLGHPTARRLGRANTKQAGNLADRGPLRLVLIADLSDHPHRPLTQLRRIPLRRTT